MSRSMTVGRVLARAGLALLAALALVMAYGILVEPRFILDEKRFTVPVPGLPEGASPTVALFSDLQVGMWFSNDGMARDIVEEVVEEQPDAALLAGDFLIGRDPLPAEQVDHVVDLLEPLTAAGIPTYAVLGNHDYHADAADQVTTALEAIGITVLRNASATVPGTDGLRVVGIGPARPDQVDIDAALEGVPADAPRVVMMHNPVTFLRLPADSAPLAVAGHTHCGQIAVPGLSAWSWYQLTVAERVVVDGWSPEGYGAPGNDLFVTCGVGFSVLPMRIAAPPQVVFFDLEPAG